MSDAIIFELKSGDMPRNPRGGGANRGSGRYETLIDRLVLNPGAWAKLGPFESQRAAENHASNARNAAYRRGYKARASVMPDFSVNIRIYK